MYIFSIISLMGGLAFFLYGMTVMSSGLERMAGSKLESSLKKMTSNPLKSLILGAGITVAIQSSSAMTVMLVGLVNSGIMNIGQTIGVIMGSNIGTTLTAWMLSLVGIETESLWLGLLKPENFSLLFALVGILLIMLSKKNKHKDIGTIFVGFAVLMYGMKLMSSAVSPLAEMPQFSRLLTAFENPIMGVIVGAVFTGIIQSSAASVGILQALALTGSLTYSMAIPIIMGQNIGTCVTALISSIGVSRNAKKVAIIHVSFNLIGTVVFLSLYLALRSFIGFAFSDNSIDALGIAIVHSTFNVATTLLLLPFTKGLEKLANVVIHDDGTPEKAQIHLLDPRLLATPSVAISECDNLTTKMFQLAKTALLSSLSLTEKYDKTAAEKILQNEAVIDRYEDQLGNNLVRLSSMKLSDKDSLRVSKMLHAIGDFERLGDHAVNVLKTAKELYEKDLSFSPAAIHELSVLKSALIEILDLTLNAYETGDIYVASQVEPLEQAIDTLVATIKSNHIKRLQASGCSIEMGFILSDLLSNFARISDHCSNIAVLVIEEAEGSFDSHRYLNDIKYGNAGFTATYEKYCAKYAL